MKSANRLTLLMMTIAAATTAVAMWCYPWPETTATDAEVGKPLFAEYSADQVRGIDIMEFNSNSGGLDRIKLVRRAEKWAVPARQNFVATNSLLIGNVINALNDRTVYEVMSENQQDHIKFEVVDPTEYTSDLNVASLGRKLVLSDRNSKPIASLIVGAAVKNDTGNKHYVRVPGKPRVYKIDFDEPLLTTEFAFWVSPNALQLNQQQGGEGLQFRSLLIDRYHIGDLAGDKNDKTTDYRATVKPSGNQLSVAELLVPVPGESNKWKKLDTIPEQMAKLKGSALTLFSFFVDDVRRKSGELAAALKSPAEEVADSLFAELPEFGFEKIGLEKGYWKFAAAEGQIAVGTVEGVRIDVMFGKVGGANSRSTGILNRYVMINAAIDYDYLREPRRPAGLADDESEENRKFRRVHDEWEQKVKEARRRARELNAIHADWLYLISDDLVNNLRPEISLPKPAAPVTEPDADTEPMDGEPEAK